MTKTYNINATEEFHKKFEELVEQFNTPQKDYEIIAYKIPGNAHWEVRKIANGTWNNWSELHKDTEVKKGNWTIKIVKRLSDGEIFSLGDQVKPIDAIDSEKSTEIISFELTPNSIITHFKEPYYFSRHIKDIKKVEKKPVLFLTEDGKEVFEGDRPWVYDKKTYDVYQWNTYGITDQADPSLNLFSTKKAAEEWRDKPIYSKQQILDALQAVGKYGVLINSNDFKQKLGI